MQIELHQLELRYECLRVADAARLGRLVGMLADQGQQNPVMVVPEADRYVLIDGYRRVKALRKLGQDTVAAVVLDLCEAEALLYRYCQQSQGPRNALEEAWLLGELTEQHGMKQSALAQRLGRSISWVSRRLALVRELPTEGHELVRRGNLCPHGAMRYLVPLARAKRSDCLRLIEGLSKHKLSERQVKQLYQAWRRVDSEQWQKIADNPLLYLKITESDGNHKPSCSSDVQRRQRELHSDLKALSGICWRARRRLVENSDCGPPLTASLKTAFRDAEMAFLSLKATIEDNDNVGSRDTYGDIATPQAGVGAPDDSPSTGHLP